MEILCLQIPFRSRSAISVTHSLWFLIHKEALSLTTLQLQNYLTITPFPPVPAPDCTSTPSPFPARCLFLPRAGMYGILRGHMYKGQVLQLLTCSHLKSFTDSDPFDFLTGKFKQLYWSSTGIITHAYTPLKARFSSCKRGRHAEIISFGHSCFANVILTSNLPLRLEKNFLIY